MSSDAARPAMRVCLDFGTSFSKASAFVGGADLAEAVRPLGIGAAAGADNAWLTPSVMLVDDGRVLVGQRALVRARSAEGLRTDPILSFKTLFAARDLEPALTLSVPAAIDPTNSLSYRDALVIYLAQLDQLVRRAIAAEPDLPASLADTPRRYTTPIWRTRAEADRIIGRLFDESLALSARLGGQLLSDDGVSLAQAKAALEQSQQALGISSLETGIFEAHAAAAAHVAFAEDKPAYFLLVDMGAGTTDIAGFERLERNNETVMSEIKPARQSCGLAGDELDLLIVSKLAHKRRSKSKEESAQFWRSLCVAARDIKRELFASGRARYQDGAGKLSISRDEVVRSSEYQSLRAELAAIIEPSAKCVIEQAKIANANAPTLLLAGGGANLALLREAADLAVRKAAGPGAAAIERIGERWRLPRGADASFREVLPQMAIALGGALVELRDSD